MTKVFLESFKMQASNLYWHGLYKQSYNLWHPDAYSHPAKMSPALCFRIIQHLEEQGFLNKDSTILDPMGGIGTTALCACLKGYKAITVELERKFIDLQRKNKDYLITRKGIKLDWTILEGDARDLVSLLNSEGLITITSPPYGNCITGEPKPQNLEKLKNFPAGDYSTPGRAKCLSVMSGGYGANPYNIGNLPDNPIVTITSPPYAEAQTGGGIAKEGYRGKHIEKQGKNQPDKVGQRCGYMVEEQGKTEGQIANFPDSNTKGQIGQLKDGTYLSEMSKIYSQLAQVSDILVIVLKDPTKGGKIRELGKDTVHILENDGWEVFDYKRAVLFEEEENKTLFGDTAKKIRGRISFFKLLAHRKGSPVSNFEHVIFVGKKTL